MANGCDAVTKYRMIAGDDEDLRVTVTVDTEAKELRFTDNGIGMTAEEVDRYINQVAFSSAEEFLKKYQPKIRCKNHVQKFLNLSNKNFYQ